MGAYLHKLEFSLTLNIYSRKFFCGTFSRRVHYILLNVAKNGLMSLVKKTIILIITILFVLWGQLGAFQSNCHCSAHKQYQKESISKHSCCANHQEMPNCHKTLSKQKTQSNCHNEGSKGGLVVSQQYSASELCQSNCVTATVDEPYYSGQTKTVDTNLFLNSTSLALLPAYVEYPLLQDERIFHHISIPIFLLNASFLI